MSEKNKDTAHRKRFEITRWIFLSFSILLNGFIIFYSCISESTTARWNSAFTNAFAKLVNNVTEKKVENIPLEKIEISFSNEENHKYNYLEGYKLEEIPLGSAKQIECAYFPVDVTNKSIIYSATPSDLVQLNQSGSIVSVIGMKKGDCVITAKSSDGGFESNLNLRVVDLVAPASYEISLQNCEISLGSTQTINFDIDGGVLGHDELINFRYYDTRKLSYQSSNESVATIDENGVIYPHSIGDSIISVLNGSYSKSLNISVNNGSSPIPFSNLSITGSNICYSNDMLLNQSNPLKYHYQLQLKDGENELNPEDFIWSSSNELLAKVDKHGVLRGFRKTSIEDENVVIAATSKTTGQVATHNVTVKSQLPTEMSLFFTIDNKTTWIQSSYTFTSGDNIPLEIVYNTPVQNKQVVATSSNSDVISLTNEGSLVTLHILKPGTSTIKISSLINPELSREITCTSVKAGAISKDNIQNVGKYIRKSIGHAAVFMVAQIFTFLTLFTFLNDKKWWLFSSISLGEGLLISVLSEIIQYFVPSRTGAILDVLIDFSGVLVGCVVAFLIALILNKHIFKTKL